MTTPHNPANLTPEIIGTADGWRLLDRDEIHSGPHLSEIDLWDSEKRKWNTEGWSGCGLEETYRTQGTRAELRAVRGLPPEPGQAVATALGIDAEGARVLGSVMDGWVVSDDPATSAWSDTGRMDWLERNLMSITHDRRTNSVDMSGNKVRGQLVNEARGSGAGPSYFRVEHRTIREAIDAAREWQRIPEPLP